MPRLRASKAGFVPALPILPPSTHRISIFYVFEAVGLSHEISMSSINSFIMVECVGVQKYTKTGDHSSCQAW